MTSVLISRGLAEYCGQRILDCAPTVDLVTVAPGERLSTAQRERIEIAVNGWFYDPHDGPTRPRFSEFLGELPNLRWVQSLGAGVDDLVPLHLPERGVVVTSAGGASSPAMAEFALGSMIMLARRFPEWLRRQGNAEWWRPESVEGSVLWGKVLVLVGYGSVARHLAPACKALGMKVIAFRRTPGYASGEAVDALRQPHSLPDALGAADFLVLTASLNSSSRHLLGAPELALMKRSAFVVNVARGGLIDQDSLVAALRGGAIAGAALDVTAPEPLPSDSPLWQMPNVIVTPHISGDTIEGWERTVDLFCSNLELYVRGQAEHLANLVPMARHT